MWFRVKNAISKLRTLHKISTRSLSRVWTETKENNWAVTLAGDSSRHFHKHKHWNVTEIKLYCSLDFCKTSLPNIIYIFIYLQLCVASHIFGIIPWLKFKLNKKTYRSRHWPWTYIKTWRMHPITHKVTNSFTYTTSHTQKNDYVAYWTRRFWNSLYV